MSQPSLVDPKHFELLKKYKQHKVNYGSEYSSKSYKSGKSSSNDCSFININFIVIIVIIGFCVFLYKQYKLNKETEEKMKNVTPSILNNINTIHPQNDKSLPIYLLNFNELDTSKIEFNNTGGLSSYSYDDNEKSQTPI